MVGLLFQNGDYKIPCVGRGGTTSACLKHPHSTLYCMCKTFPLTHGCCTSSDVLVSQTGRINRLNVFYHSILSTSSGRDRLDVFYKLKSLCSALLLY